MRIGKLPEPVLIRSVLREIGHRRDEVLVGPGVGQDCAAVEIGPGEVFVLSSDPITGTVKEIGSHSVYVTANDLAASGAEPLGIMLTIMLPEETEEAQLKEMMRGVEKACEILHMEVMGGHTEITRAVNQPLISLTGVGKMKKEDLITTSGIKPGQDLVVTKWIGLEATSIIAKEREKELLNRFSLAFVEEAKNLDQHLSVLPEARIAVASGAPAMHDITEGGIFGALWEMGSGGDVGLTIDLRSIPIRQETVEICEEFGLNPYQIMSSGSLLIAIDDGEELVSKLQQEGINASVVGKTTAGKDRILRNRGEVRYLDKPQPDELYKIYEKEV
jgi:hydrogenase expression/formation protein HypE